MMKHQECNFALVEIGEAEKTGYWFLQGGDLEEKVANLMSAREQIYMETAHMEVITDGKNPPEIIANIMSI